MKIHYHKLLPKNTIILHNLLFFLESQYRQNYFPYVEISNSNIPISYSITIDQYIKYHIKPATRLHVIIERHLLFRVNPKLVI